MQSAIRSTMPWVAVAAAVTLLGCGKDDSKGATPAASADADTSPSASAATAPSAGASGSASSGSASASASDTPTGPPVDCPKGSAGPGTFTKPCDAKGGSRMMDVTWTGKTDEKGPHFRVTNKSPSTILYGKVAVYFYDKAGKQLDVMDNSAVPAKSRRYHSCGGNMFGGVMKAGEKAVLMFSCVGKDVVPTGTASVEAEMQIVGFTDETEKKITYYWRNADLTPDARSKGGVK
jgi:hypothetical protein